MWVVHIHSNLICRYLCSTEQNNNTSLKKHNEWFIFMAKVDLCQSEKRFFLGISVARCIPVLLFFSVLQVAVLVLLCV